MDWKSDLVPFGISVCGIDELPDFAHLPITHVLSILDPCHPELPVFARYPAHARLELRFNDVIAPRGADVLPEKSDVDLLLAFGRDLAAEAKSPGRGSGHLLVHCHAGISRSTASMILILAQARTDLSAEAIVGELVRIRPRAWPNLRIVRYGDELLGRGGTLVEAVKRHYAHRVREQPELAQYFREAGRAEEVEGL